MELALVTGARPEYAGALAIIRLAPGRWRFRTQHVNDSIVKLRAVAPPSNIDEPIQDGAILVVENPTTIQCYFEKRGTERFINIWAEKVNGNRHANDAPEVAQGNR